MINTNITYDNRTEDVIVSIISKDNDLEFVKTLWTHNFKIHQLDHIPDRIESWEVSPDTIILDTAIHSNWEKQVEALLDMEVYKDIPLIVLYQDERTIEDIFANQDSDFLCVYREDTKAILQSVIAMIRYWKKLNDALVKTNQINRILSTNYLVLDAKNDCLESVQKQIEHMHPIVTPEIKKQLTKLDNMIADNLKKGYHYQLFKAHFEEVHPLFFRKLLAVNKDLSNNDLKLAAFLKMNFNNSEISFFMGISMAGVKKAIQRLRIKLQLAPKESLRQFIFTIEV